MTKKAKNKEIFQLIPFDGANLKEKGASLAPEILFNYFKNYEKTKVNINNFNLEETQKNIEKSSYSLFKNKRFVISLGGDHSITYGILKGAKKALDNVSLIYFDAHIDAEDDFLPPSHEDVIKALVNSKTIKPKDLLIVGARNYWKKEQEFIEKNKIQVAFASETKDKILLKIKNFLKNTQNLYVSVDIDFFDKSVAFATPYSEKNGFLLKDFKEFTTFPEFKRIIGYDIVELSPSIDKDKITTTLASNVIKELLAKRDNYTETYI